MATGPVSRIVAGALAAAALLLGPPVFGQSPLVAANGPAAPDEGTEAPSTVVITGSRIASPNMSSTSPIQVVGEQEIKQQGTTDIVDLMNNLPQVFQNTAADFSNTPNPLVGPGGVTTADLRGIGPQRTLVLIDGRRLGVGDANTGNPNPAPDLDQIPPQLVQRIDVVTGGASATYGSDAIAGVINFIMKRDFEGVQFDAQYGENNHHNGNTLMPGLLAAQDFPDPKSDVWDGKNKTFSVIVGTNLGDHKGNVTAYANYRSADPVSQGSRDFSACKLNVTPDKDNVFTPACNGSPTSNQFLVTAIGTPGYSVVGNQFLPYPQAGSNPPPLFNSSPYQYLSRADTRYSAGAFANYEVNDFVRPYADVMFMNDRSTTAIAPSGLFEFSNPLTPTGGVLVNCNNPFLSAQQQATVGCSPADIAAGNNVDLSIGRRNVEGGPRVARYEHMNYRLVLGNKGSIGSAWTYDVYGSYYYTTLQQSNDGYVSWAAASKALQVVDVNGTPTCKSVVDQTDRNCVPWNIFSQGGVTQDALNYISSFGAEYGTVEEKIVSGNISGSLGAYGIKSPWASDGVGVSFGLEHRTDTENFRPDEALLSGDLSGTGGALVGINASDHVQDTYGELRVPIAQDLPGVNDSVFEGGFRHSNYSISGGVNTWKLGLQYAPVPDIRLRASFQRAIRAPNLVELFLPNSVTNSGTLTSDPCSGPNPVASFAQCALTGVTAAQYGHISQCPAGQCSTETGGNRNLKPEIGDTISVGFTVHPAYLPDFVASVDYYHIELKDEINTVPNNTAFNSCLNTGAPADCALIVRNSLGGLTAATVAGGGYVIGTGLNIAQQTTAGIDTQLSYRYRLGAWGAVTANLSGSWIEESTTQTRSADPTFDCVGLYGATCVITPRWRHTMRVGWETPWNVLLSANWRYFASVQLDSNSAQPTLTQTPLDNSFDAKLPSVSYLDLSAIWTIRHGLEVRAGVNNVLDKDPPLVSSLITGTGAPNTYPTYDLLGRVLYVGATLKL